MSTRQLYSVLVIVSLVLTGCTATLPSGDSGSVALIPFFDSGSGISGVVPVTCHETMPGTFECPDLASDGSMAVIVQNAFPGTLDGLVDLVLAQIDSEQLPAPAGRLKGRAFDWDLYSLETEISELGPGVKRVELALAEDGAASYFVALITLPEIYDAHPDLFDTIFTHTVYGLMPWE